MPLEGSGERTAQQRMSSRRPVSQRETYRYYPKVEVTARPVDAYAAPGRVSQRTQALIQALEQGQGLLASYAQIQKQQEEEARQEGYELGKIGKKLPENASDSKIKGWLQAQGEGAVFDFERDIQEYTLNNWQQDPETYQQGINDLITQYIDGKSKAFLKGFVPKAEQVEQQYYRKYMQAHQEKIMNDGLNNLAKGFRQDFANLVEGDNYSPEKVRSLLSEYQKKGKKFGLSRDEVSKRMIALVGREAEKAGDPELLSFVEVEDEQGIKLTDTKLRENIRTWRKRAVDSRDQLIKAREAHYKELKKEAKAQLQRNIVTMLHGLENPTPEQLIAVKQDILDRWSTPEGNELGIALDAKDMKTYLDTINDLLATGEFAENSDPNTVAALQELAATISSPEDFEIGMQMLSSFKHNLSGSDYTRLHQKMLSEREAMEDKEIQNFKTFHNRAIGTFTPLLRQGSDTLFGGYMKDDIEAQDEERVNYGLNRLQEAVDRFREENGRTPTYEEYYRLQDRVKKEAYEAFPRVEGLSLKSSAVERGRSTGDKSGTSQAFAKKFNEAQENSSGQSLGYYRGKVDTSRTLNQTAGGTVDRLERLRSLKE